MISQENSILIFDLENEYEFAKVAIVTISIKYSFFLQYYVLSCGKIIVCVLSYFFLFMYITNYIFNQNYSFMYFYRININCSHAVSFVNRNRLL